MKYQEIWNKVLAQGEEVKYEFSIGQKYLNLFMWLVGGFFGFCGLINIFISAPMGIVFFVISGIAIFYYKVYVPKSNAYAFTNKRVMIHKGWLSTAVTSINYDKITDIVVSEAFFDRIWSKTGTIKISTAGSNGTEVVLKHIENPYKVKIELDNLRD